MLRTLLDLSGRVALISGGSRGLGLQIAEALGEFGAIPVLVARRGDELAAAVAHLAGQDIRAVPIAADLADPAAAEGVAARTLAVAGRIDILVNNAGTAWGAPAESHPLDAWRKVIDLNLTGTFLLTQAVGRAAMLPAGAGRILNIASVEGLRGRPPGMPGTIAYATSKGGMISFTRSLAAEWGPRGITVNAIAPGFFPSRMTRGTLERFGAGLLARTPLGRLGGPHDLKGAALLFASDAGGHITGQVLAIDGGATSLL
ncbi:MAG TPA: SDR family oxidoreductase [Acetobacteraceae bacterium]|nr:SDR family oxidoreductase [Acetobacteraceae bacterium]